MLERAAQSLFIYRGASIGYYQGDTIKLLDDVAELKPTVFVSVPRLFNRIYDKVLAGVKAKGGVTSFLFFTAFNAKKEGLKNGHVTHFLWDKTVFGQVRVRQIHHSMTYKRLSVLSLIHSTFLLSINLFITGSPASRWPCSLHAERQRSHLTRGARLFTHLLLGRDVRGVRPD